MGAIQIKNVPEELHDVIRSRAAQEGKTVSDYVLGLVKRDLETPTIAEWLARLKTREPVEPFDSVELLHQVREEWDQELERRIGQPPLSERDDGE
jgi:plasmid stability protein